jgi:Tol biopolymer transport system component
VRPVTPTPEKLLLCHVRRTAAFAAMATVFALTAVPIVRSAASQTIPPVGTLPGRIVYTRAASSSTDFTIDVFIADADGENESQLTNTVDSRVYGSARGEDQPRWSPDGLEVAFSTANRDGLVSVWRVPATGGTPTPVVVNDGEGGDQSWEPDGRCMVYAGAHVGGDSTLDLKRICSDGSTSILAETADVDERAPDVSPDGSSVVYEARRPPKSYSDRTQWSLRRMAIDGSGDELLYSPSQESALYPRWSPQGTTIAFIEGRLEGIGTLSVLDVATRQVTRLATLAAGPIAWSPDGQTVLFYNTDANGPQVVSSSPAGPAQPQQAEQLLGLYVIGRSDRQLQRLLGAAGGADAKDDSYQWGYAADWWAPSATPTPTATHTSTNTPTATATTTPTPTETPVAGRVNYLPLVSLGVALGDR